MKLLGHVTFASVGMGASSILGLVFFALVGRKLGPEAFGVLSTVFALNIFAVDLVELTQNTALIRASGGGLPAIRAALKISFIHRLKGAFVVTLFALLAAYPLSVLLRSELLLFPYLITFVGYAGFLLYGLVLGYFQVTRKFHWYAAFLTLNNALRLVFWIALTFLGAASLTSAVLLLTLSVWVIAGVGWFFLPGGFLRTQEDSREFSRDNVFDLTRFFAIAAFQSRLDVPMLLRFAGAVQAGLYGAAARIWLPAQSALGAVSTVFAPEWATVNSRAEVKQGVRNMTAYIVMLLAGTFGMILLFPQLLSLFGHSFREASMAGRLFGVSVLVNILTLPATTFLLYAIKATGYLTKVAIVQLISMVAFGVVLIPAYGAVGASITVLMTATIALLLINVAAWRRYRGLAP